MAQTVGDTPNAAAPKGLLSLSAELRNAIYYLVIPNALASPGHNRILWKDAINEQPGIMRACKQLRQETLPIYYASITPILESTAHATASFQALISDPANQLLKQVKVIGFIVGCGTEDFNVQRCLPPHHALLLVRPSRGIFGAVDALHGTFASPGQHSPDAYYDAADATTNFGSHVQHFRQFCCDTNLTNTTCSVRRDLKVLLTKVLQIRMKCRRASFEADDVLAISGLVRRPVAAREGAESADP